MSNSRLQGIQNWRERAHGASYSVSALARSCKVSVRTLERLFSLRMGESPYRYITRLRMERAQELLVGGKSVKETAYSLGYKRQNHFSRVFRVTYGCSPSEFLIPPSSARPVARLELQ